MLKKKKIGKEKKRNHSLFSKNHGVLILETAGGGGGLLEFLGGDVPLGPWNP